jgi:3-dehydro-L-gulonate 2-dehydrogenase
MAMSLFSYGTMELYQMHGELLPVEGGFDINGQLTRDPSAILESRRPLPTGYWKGSGLSLMLDLIAAILSGGSAVYQIQPDPDLETRISQVFIAIDPSSTGQAGLAAEVADRAIAFLKSTSDEGGDVVRYPGERVVQVREENLEKGIPVEPAVWKQVQDWAESGRW